MEGVPEPFSVRGDPRAVAVWTAALCVPAAAASWLLSGTAFWWVPWLWPPVTAAQVLFGRLEWDGRTLRYRLGRLSAGVRVDGATARWSRVRGSGAVLVDGGPGGGRLWIQVGLWSGEPGRAWAPVVERLVPDGTARSRTLPLGRAGWGLVVPPLAGVWRRFR